jgi:short-subunit dehydrogenase
MRAPFRVVVITGASSGLGASLASAYAAPQVVLGLIGRSRERLEAVAAACTGRGAQVYSEAIDVADATVMAEWLTDFDRNNPVELLVANAGISAGIEDGAGYESPETTTRQIEVNLLGSVNTVAPLLPGLCARRRGQIALIASVAGLRGLPYSPGYCASKAGVRAYGEALRPLLEPQGVGVSVICPGFFTSRMTDRWEGPTPFLVSGERAARRIKRGIDQARRRIAFPFPLVVGMRFCDLAPAALGDEILRRFRFRIRSA